MKDKLSCVVLLGIFTLLSCNAASLNTNELEAKEFVRIANATLNTINEKLRLLEYEIETILEDDVILDNRNQLFLNLTDNLAQIARESKLFDSSQFKDDELKYVFEIINQQAGDAALGGWWFLQLLKSVSAVESMRIRKNISKFRDTAVKIAILPDIQKIIAYTNDTKELKYYWKEWREHNSDTVLKNIMSITDLILQAAKANGISPLEHWMKGFNITEMEQIMNETKPLYLQLHAFIRTQLYKKYGGTVIKRNGIIPDHLFRQVIAQTWTNASIIDEMFPIAQFPPYNNILKEKNYGALELYKSADGFYKSLGFDSLPDNYWGSAITLRMKRDGSDCKPSINDATPNVLLFYCHKMDFRTFLEAHGYMGRMYYAREKTNLPAYFFGSYGLESSVGEAAKLSASTFNHLKTIGLLDSFEYSQEIEFNQLLRMGFHTLLSIQQQFVHTKVLADFFAGKVELGLLNKHYWKLMDQYVGVGPPMNRISNTYDFPYQFYIEINDNREASNFNSEIFGYQFYKKLCQISGKYSNDALHTCDFFGSKDVGDALRKMMRLGSSKRLNKVLETLFPENPRMSSDGLLEYYSPMKNWLTEKNQEANAELGWTHSNKKVNRVILDSGEDYDDE